MIKDFIQFLRTLYPLWKKIRTENKAYRFYEKKIKHDGEIATFLDVFENHMIDELPENLVKVILTEFAIRYFNIEEKNEMDISLEPVLLQYMDLYEVKR